MLVSPEVENAGADALPAAGNNGAVIFAEPFVDWPHKFLAVVQVAADVAVAAFPPIDKLAAVPVKPVPAPVNEVEERTPVLGLYRSLVDETFSVVMLPAVALVNVK